MKVKELSDTDLLKLEAQMIRDHEIRMSDIQKRKRNRHVGMTFNNPLFEDKIALIKKEKEERGLII